MRWRCAELQAEARKRKEERRNASNFVFFDREDLGDEIVERDAWVNAGITSKFPALPKEDKSLASHVSERV